MSASTTPPPRGFPEAEFISRTERFQLAMRAEKCDAVILTTEPNVRYFTGFFTQFWQSPTRPWFVVIPASGKPIAIIPEIGSAGMRDTWLDDVRTWPSPRPEDDGIADLKQCIDDLPKRFGQIGMTLGAETMLRMPQQNFERLRSETHGVDIVDIGSIMHRVRMVKSELEIAKTRYICSLASAAFANVKSYVRAGMTERETCRKMQLDLLVSGADTVAYMVAGSGQGGYDSIIMGPTDRVLLDGDVLIIDTGSTWDGYFCDFDRNWGFMSVDALAMAAYRTVWQATEAGFSAARPGATTSDIWAAMSKVMEGAGSLGNEVGRLGHGLGIELTEKPSNTKNDATALKAGMVLTLEPGMTFAKGKQMIHEENIVITEDGAEWLTERAEPEMPVLV